MSASMHRSRSHCLKPPPQLVRRGEGSNKTKATSPHPPCTLIGFCAVILFPRIATILSAQRGVYPGQDPLASGQGASSDPILSLRDQWQLNSTTVRHLVRALSPVFGSSCPPQISSIPYRKRYRIGCQTRYRIRYRINNQRWP